MFKSLKSKLLSAFAVVAVATGVVGFFGLRALHSVDELMAEVTHDIAPSNGHVQDMQIHFYRALWVTSRGILAAGNRQADRATELNRSRDLEFQATEIVESNGPARDALMASAAHLEELAHERLSKVSDEGDAVAASATALIWTVGVLAVLAAAALGFFITLSITRPVDELRTAHRGRRRAAEDRAPG
jgi:hypothetical protein